MKTPQGFILYKIYYGSQIVYLGRTKQPLQSRLRGHFFAKPMHKKIDIEGVARIEYAECKTLADMYLYEIYYINKLHPTLNVDDCARDNLTVTMPDLTWKSYNCPLMTKWKAQIIKNTKAAEELRKRKKQFEIEKCEMRLKRRRGEITEDEYYDFLEVQGF